LALQKKRAADVRLQTTSGLAKVYDLVTHIYEATKSFPNDERFGLTSQLRKASVSVPSNIAEGHDRLTRGEYLQFLGNARGSLVEVETQLLIASRLGYLSEERNSALAREIVSVRQMLSALIASLRGRRSPSQPLA